MNRAFSSESQRCRVPMRHRVGHQHFLLAGLESTEGPNCASTDLATDSPIVCTFQ